MENIEVGEWVRINNDFRLIALGIGKVIKISQDTIYVKMNLDLPIALKIENITRHSFNLIDLIEVGDYVNGKEVYSEDGKLAIELAEHMPPYELLEDMEIKSILTHEQYEQNCYTVERKEKC